MDNQTIGGLIIDFIKSVVRGVNIGRTQSMAAAVNFGNDARVDFNLNQWTTTAEVLAAIDQIEYRGGNTNTTGGLREARQSVFIEGAGDRPQVANVLVLITDGLPSREVDGLQDEVDRIKALGITIIAVGVTRAVSETLLKIIVTPPVDENYLPVTDFNKLNRSILQLTTTSCQATQASLPSTPSTSSATASTISTTTTTTATPSATTITTTTTTTTPTTTTTTTTTLPKPTQPTVTNSIIIAVCAGVGGSVLLLVIIIVVTVKVLKSKKRKKRGASNNLQSLPTIGTDNYETIVCRRSVISLSDIINDKVGTEKRYEGLQAYERPYDRLHSSWNHGFSQSARDVYNAEVSGGVIQTNITQHGIGDANNIEVSGGVYQTNIPHHGIVNVGYTTMNPEREQWSYEHIQDPDRQGYEHLQPRDGEASRYTNLRRTEPGDIGYEQLQRNSGTNPQTMNNVNPPYQALNTGRGAGGS